jgi:hypothetical protein
MVKGRYWVILDEVRTEAAAEVELRFHTYGAVEGKGGQRIVGKQAELEVESKGNTGLTVEVAANPEGLEPAENVVAVKATEKRKEFAIATVLYPVKPGEKGHTSFSLREKDKDTLEAVIERGGGTDTVTWVRDGMQWKLSGVR